TRSTPAEGCKRSTSPAGGPSAPIESSLFQGKFHTRKKRRDSLRALCSWRTCGFRPVRTSVATLVLVGAAAAAVAGCRGHKATSDDDAEAGITETTSGDAGPVTIERIDAGSGNATAPQIAALEQTTPIFNVSEWPAKDPSKTSDERQGA